MGKILDTILKVGAGVLAVGAVGLLIKDSAEEQERKNTPCRFDEVLTEEKFKDIAVGEAKKIKRLWVDVSGAIVNGEVISSSGLTKWKFTLDFNDYGSITGKCWKRTDNNDSQIPDILETRIKERISECIRGC